MLRSKVWNTLFQGLEQVIPGLGIPPKQILEQSIEGISVKKRYGIHIESA